MSTTKNDGFFIPSYKCLILFKYSKWWDTFDLRNAFRNDCETGVL